MKNRYYSKIDWWIGLLLGWVIVFEFIQVIKDVSLKPSLGTVIGILIIALTSWILFGTYYEFKENYLLVKSGPFSSEFYYDKIVRLTYKKTLIASTALSTDRIEIIYNGSLGGYISPKEKDEFVKKLEKKCIAAKS